VKTVPNAILESKHILQEMLWVWQDCLMDAFNVHPTEDELEQYVLNCEESRDRIEEHLLICHACLDTFETVQREVAWIKQALSSEMRQHAIVAVA
jgi:hypothetical protein